MRDKIEMNLLLFEQLKISWPGSFSVRRSFQRSAFSFAHRKLEPVDALTR